MRTKLGLVAAISISASALVSIAFAADEVGYYFRPHPVLIGPSSTVPPINEDEDDGEALTIWLSEPSVYGLTVGQASSQLALSASGNAAGVTYRASLSSYMPGLAVNPSSGTVSGTPTGSDGDEYRIVVEALRDGKAVALSQEVVETLRAPLSIDMIPDDLELMVDDPLPSAGISAGALGGDADTISWSLVNAPDWLTISGAGSRTGILQLAAGHTVTDTPLRPVTVRVADGDGRTALSAPFSVVALSGPDCEEGPVGTVCGDGAVYVGNYNGVRKYMAPADEPGLYQYKTTTLGTEVGNFTDGMGNTNATASPNYPAAFQCRSRGANWYLPALYEMRDTLLQSGNNDLLGDMALTALMYWTSTRDWVANTSSNAQNNVNATNLYPVRCFRQ